jgi:hypothetical protein
VGLFRRREPLHEQLAREGGLDEPRPPDPRPGWQETGIHGLQRPREWDLTVSADATIAEGTRVTFVALADNTLLVEDGDVPDATPLAERIERELPPPYRARAALSGLWMIQAKKIEVVSIPDGPEGDTIEWTADGIRVDGERIFGSIPELENRGDVVRAERLDGELWEFQAETL